MVAIIGENGSGKTTLLKHLNGIYLPTKGTVSVDGMDTHHPENLRKIRSTVGMVFQNPENQIVASTVEEDIAFGLENKNLPTGEIRQRVNEQLQISGLANVAQRPPHLLSGGQIQKLALAGVLARQPRIILFDEPTSMLDPATREDFLRSLCRLRDQGITIIYVTHYMEEAAYADRVIVLHEGMVGFEGSPTDVFSQSKIFDRMGIEAPPALYIAEQFRSIGIDIPADILTSKDLLDAIPKFKNRKFNLIEPPLFKITGQEIILSDNVHYTYLSGTPLAQPALNGVNISVREHHIHGIAGVNGSGKSTLLQHFIGILRPEKGHLRIADMTLEDSDTALRDVIRKVGMVFQNPETQFFEVFVGDEIAYGPKQFHMDNIRERVQRAMIQVGLDFTAFKDRRLETLSGGEKRKVALASTLALDQDILCFDEPTAGMDPHSRREFLKLFNKLNHAGKTIIIATHQLDDLAEISEALSIMKDGQIIQTDVQQKVFFDPLFISQAGLTPPLTVRVTQKLIEEGWQIMGLGTTTPDHLLKVLRKVVE
jgi:energy-coupling factor transport system ATP-binding protein